MENSKNSENNTPTGITVIEGDGIGPEIMESTKMVMKEAGVKLDFHMVEAGEKIYLSGKMSGIQDSAWETIRAFPVILKGPITTPRGTGYKSLNVTIRKTLGLFANVRPAKTYNPFISTKFANTDMVIIRENEEDTYAGIEHRQTQEVTQCLKLITKPGTEKIIRYAFEFAKSNGRKKITCMVKDNIMKITDGLFAKMFTEIANEYPTIETESMIIDIGAARLATKPQKFDVILAPNLYGDILSDIAAEVTGSVGLCGSANIGDFVSMFEAIHGSAPDIAGKDISNPTALLKSAVMMLVHLGMPEKAQLIRNAILKTIEDGILTKDTFSGDKGTKEVGTKEFTKSIIQRLGKNPDLLHINELKKPNSFRLKYGNKKESKELQGVDIFLDMKDEKDPIALANKLEQTIPKNWKLKMITNRGVKVYPDGNPETFLTDHFRCRFVPQENSILKFDQIIELQSKIHFVGLEIIKTENLYAFDGVPGYSLGQGE